MPLSGRGTDRFTEAATYRHVQLAGANAHSAIVPRGFAKRAPDFKGE